jgi:hypothetical protein
VNDANLLGANPRQSHELPLDANRIAGDETTSIAQISFEWKISPLDHASATRREDDRDLRSQRRHAAPKVGVVQEAVNDDGLLRAQDVDQPAERRSGHPPHTQNIAWLASWQLAWKVILFVVPQRKNRLEARRKPFDQLEDLTLGTSLNQGGNKKEYPH